MLRIYEYYVEMPYADYLHYKKEIDNFNPFMINIFSTKCEIVFKEKGQFYLFLRYIDQVNGELWQT